MQPLPLSHKEMQPEFEVFARNMKWEYCNLFDKRWELIKGPVEYLPYILFKKFKQASTQ